MNLYKELTAAAKKIDKDSKKMIHITRIKTEADKQTARPATDYYYIINGFYMVKVHAAIYHTAIMPAAPVFMEVQPGEAITRHAGDSMPKKSEPIKVLDIIPKDRGEKLTDTGYMMPYCKNNIHIFDAGKDKIAFNHNYIEMLRPFIVGDLYAKSPVTPAQCDGLTDPGADTGALILPVRIAAEMKYQVVRADEIGTKTEREARKAAKEEAAGIIEEAKKEAAALLEKTQEEAAAAAAEITRQNNAGDVLKETKEKAAAILAEAKREAAKIAEETDHLRATYGAPGEATKAALKIIKEAEAEAEKIIKAARIEAGKIKMLPQEAAPEEVKPEEVKQEAKKARLVRNEEKHGIELYFEEVPRASVRNTLKAGGYKWHATKQCWYAKQSDKAEKIAAALIG